MLTLREYFGFSCLPFESTSVFHAYPSRVPRFFMLTLREYLGFSCLPFESTSVHTHICRWVDVSHLFMFVLFCLSSFCLLCSVFLVSLNHPFLITSSLFSSVYSARFRCEQFHTETCIKKE